MDPDDWFGDERAAPVDWNAPDPDARPADGYAEDWRPPARAAGGPTVRLGTLLVLGGVAVVGVVVGVLFLAGVFSGDGKRAATQPPPTTTQSVTTPTTTATTTARQPVPAPSSTSKPGDTGVQVKALQRALARLGYGVGKVDGVYGPSTKTALEQFQKRAKLTADGVFGAASLKALKQALAAAG